MRKKSKVLLIFLFVFISLTTFGIVIINKINQEMNQLTSSDIPEINLLQIEIGTYMGIYESLLIKVKVEVTIFDHTMTEIMILEHQNGQGDGADVIINTVLIHQSIDVDFISGATFSSKAILLAISDALSHKNK